MSDFNVLVLQRWHASELRWREVQDSPKSEERTAALEESHAATRALLELSDPEKWRIAERWLRSGGAHHGDEHEKLMDLAGRQKE